MDSVLLTKVFTLFADQIHLTLCLVLLFLSRKEKLLISIIFFLTAQSMFDTIAHFALKTYFIDYAKQLWFVTFIASQTFFIVAVYLKQRYFGVKLKIDQIVIMIGGLMLLMQLVGLVTVNVIDYKGSEIKIVHGITVQSLAALQLIYLAMAVSESRRDINLLGNR